MSAADDGRSLGQLVAAATAEMSALVHDEIALAKAELRQDAKRGAMGSGAAIVALAFLLFALPVLSFAAAYGIHNLGLGLAWSFLIVGGAFILLALILLGLAALKFKKISKSKGAQKSMASAKESAAVLSHAKPHPREGEDKAKESRPLEGVTRSSV
ncbi:phage holin family protein [Streptomyces sp. NBC_01186]|uniref:phage holin family protein n=1 Tax=Streptomyces sp. NBC_01186 TaxID=2903765 RepID=UPI002E1317B2|nr:phage holin family protein [Streptomyces sp. NBC_01186]